jgi:hypothetical protein
MVSSSSASRLLGESRRCSIAKYVAISLNQLLYLVSSPIFRNTRRESLNHRHPPRRQASVGASISSGTSGAFRC